MKPGGAKAKGAEGERELAKLLTSVADEAGIELDLSRNLEQTRSGGHDLTGLEQYGLAVEVKRVEAPGINAWWAQAVRQAEAIKCYPVLAHRRNRQPWRFRVKGWVWPAQSVLDLDMELEPFKLWFIAHLKEHMK